MSISVSGLSLAEITEAIRDKYPRLSIKSVPGALAAGEVAIYVDTELSQLRKEKESLTEQASKSLKAIQTFHQQQQALFDEFVVLRQKYDDQKSQLIGTLWTQTSPYHPELGSIPKIEGPDFIETEKMVGQYIVEEPLGEGQFATVCRCRLLQQELAIKIIKKERITSFMSLRRVSNEIKTLRTLSESPRIISINDVIQTETKLYIITEKGGTDLFEFFDEHADGVSEAWALQIISGVLQAVLFCHEHSICHRDLKPENILLRFDTNSGVCTDLKLCDFGLSTEFHKKIPLSDFCGSPGFFCPEMITNGVYYGDKADIWSTGCILLELILGHEKFCSMWMGPYDYGVMQDRDQFKKEMHAAVASLKTELHFSSELNDIVVKFLMLDAVARPQAITLIQHPWFGDHFKDLLEERDSSQGDTHSPVRAGSLKISVANPMTNASPNLSNRERRFLEAYMKTEGGAGQKAESAEELQLHLPPIEPATPSIHKARKMLMPQSPANSDSGSGKSSVLTSKSQKELKPPAGIAAPDHSVRREKTVPDRGGTHMSRTVDTLDEREESEAEDISASLRVQSTP